MYFHRCAAIFRDSCKDAFSDVRFLLFGFLLILCCFQVPGLEFIRLHALSQIIHDSVQIQIISLIVQLGMFVLSFVVAVFIFPMLSMLVYKRQTNQGGIQIGELSRKTGAKRQSFFLLFFTYENILFLLSGGGFLVVIAGLMNSILYQTNVVTITDVTRQFPLVSALVTIGVILSIFLSLLFTIVFQELIFDEGHLMSAIFRGVALFNKDFSDILFAWIFIGLVCLIPLILIFFFLHLLSIVGVAFQIPGGVLFTVVILLLAGICTVTLAVVNIYWTRIYLKLTGRLN